jgi:TetR/AcrR family transcriptional regulator, transcriptional repressor for nem operon
MNSKFSNKKAQSRERILDAASRAVRRSGFHGVGVAEVMREAGLTHGGFYSHFASRDALLAEAVIRASKDIGVSLTAHVDALAKHGQSVFSAFVETYLSDGQISDCENGCPVAALCGEIPSQVGEVLASSRQIIINLHKLVEQALPSDSSAETAWAVASALIGAMQLARALGDNKQGRTVLAAARADLISRYDTCTGSERKGVRVR